MVEPHGPGKVNALDGSVSVTIGVAVAIMKKRRVPDATPASLASRFIVLYREIGEAVFVGYPSTNLLSGSILNLQL